MAKAMTDDTLKAIVKSLIASSVGSTSEGTDLAADRETALKYYRGDPLGNETDGRSKIVSRDVADTVDGMLPSILEIFTASDDVVRYDPVGAEDQEFAEQATQYANYIFHYENPGYSILQTAFKDAMLQRTGIIKSYWEEADHTKTETYRGLTAPEIAKLAQDETLELLEQKEREEELIDPATGQPAMVKVIDAKFVRTETKGRYRVDNVPPEEFLFSKRAVRLEDEFGDMVIPFVCHRVKRSISDLVEEGFDFDVLNEIPSSAEGEYNSERTSRHDDDDLTDQGVLDRSMREIWLHECYLRVDTDGDGIAETRKVLVGGTAHTILLNEEVDEQPFTLLCPYPMPHTLIGQSVADQVMDIQQWKTTLIRQINDNVFNVNNSRSAVSNKVDLDTLLNNAIGSAVIVDSDQADIGGHIVPMQTASIAQHIFPLLEYADQVREARSGVSRLSQGLDPDALNDTAAGMSMLMSASQRRQMLVARNFADGIRCLFKKILRAVVKYQDKPKMIRLRGGFAEVDPANWNAQMDVTVNVALGSGNRQQQLVGRKMILDYQLQGVQMQGGLHGPLVFANHVSHAFKKLVEATGEQQPEAYVEDVNPEAAHQPPPPQPSPEMAKVEAETQAKQAELQMKGQMAQADMAMKQQMSQADLQMRAQADQQEGQRKAAETAQKMALEREKLAAQIELERERARVDMQIAMMKAELDRDIAMMKASQQVELEREKAVANASLEKERMDREDKRERDRPEPKETKAETVVPNITINAGAKKRRVNVERDSAGEIIGALVEDDD